MSYTDFALLVLLGGMAWHHYHQPITNRYRRIVARAEGRIP